MTTPLRLLILEDVEADAELMLIELRQCGFEPVWERVDSEAEYLARLEPTLDVILADYTLPQFDALRALQRLRERGLGIPFIVVSGSLGDERAADLIKQGAADYLLKDRLGRLGQAVGAAVEGARAHRQIKEMERRYTDLFERVPVGLYRATPDGRILDANPALVEILGFSSREALLGVNQASLYVDPGERDRGRDFVARGERGRNLETQLRRSDGSVIWVDQTVRAIRDTAGRVVGYEGALLDSTQRKQGELATQSLTDLGRRLVATLDVTQVQHSVVSVVQEFFRAHRAVLFELEQATEVLVCIATAGPGNPEDWVGKRLPIGSAVSGRAIAERRAVWTSNISAEPQISLPEWVEERIEEEGYGAVATIPLIVSGHVLGTLALLDVPGRVFSEADLRLLTGFADQAAIALENSRRFAAAVWRRREAEVLADVVGRLAETLDASEVSQRLVWGALSLLRGHSSRLWLRAPDDSLVTVASAGLSPHYLEPGYVLGPGVGVVGRAMAEGRTVQCSDLLAEPGLVLTAEWRALCARMDARAVLATPLRDEGAVIGVLTVVDRAGRVFTEDEVRLFQTFSGYAAIAIRNARSYAAEQVARNEVAASEERYRGLFDGVPLGLFRTTPEGRIVDANLAMARILGYPDRERLVAMEATELYLNLEDRQRFQRLLLEQEVLFDFETQFRRSDGTIRWVRLSARSIRDEQSRVRYYEGALEDITERKDLEEQLRQAQKLEAIGSLAGGIAHDFNNLLTVIMGRSQIATSHLEPDSPVRRNVDLIARTAERAAGLTRQLLAFSRKQVLEPRVLDLGQAVSGVRAILQRLIAENIAIVTESDPELWRVKVDPSQIEQVILNLAVNARDAMPDGGRITIETRNVALDAHATAAQPGVEPGAFVRLAVTDTGHGMDAKTRAQIFEPFFTTKPAGEGTGLGLSTVYGIVKQSGGHIRVQSEVRRGASFEIYLPRVEEALEPAAEAPSRARHGTETLLLVEDDHQVRAVARETLQIGGYTVLEAMDSEEALGIAQEHTGMIHLLVTDVVLPGGSGRVLADCLLPLRPSLKVLFMSGYPAHAIGHHGILDPGTWFLQKPFTPGVLARRVREVLDAGA
jgi:PAS domain S-box-containing protein